VISSEVVWNDGPGSGGGGGISDLNPLPPWQKGIVPPSVNPGAHVGRGVPDVSGNADPDTGYTIFVGGKSMVVGGTSAVAPLWAALVARINQQLGTPVGYFNPLLYSKLSKSGGLRDITSGNNDTSGHVGGYSAGKGWDAASGWGSPVGSALLTAFGG
jgi:kumamolisin